MFIDIGTVNGRVLVKVASIKSIEEYISPDNVAKSTLTLEDGTVYNSTNNFAYLLMRLKVAGVIA